MNPYCTKPSSPDPHHRTKNETLPCPPPQEEDSKRVLRTRWRFSWYIMGPSRKQLQCCIPNPWNAAYERSSLHFFGPSTDIFWRVSEHLRLKLSNHVPSGMLRTLNLLPGLMPSSHPWKLHMDLLRCTKESALCQGSTLKILARLVENGNRAEKLGAGMDQSLGFWNCQPWPAQVTVMVRLRERGSWAGGQILTHHCHILSVTIKCWPLPSIPSLLLSKVPLYVLPLY
jgi:hypothetical protein